MTYYPLESHPNESEIPDRSMKAAGINAGQTNITSPVVICG